MVTMDHKLYNKTRELIKMQQSTVNIGCCQVPTLDGMPIGSNRYSSYKPTTRDGNSTEAEANQNPHF